MTDPRVSLKWSVCNLDRGHEYCADFGTLSFPQTSLRAHRTAEGLALMFPMDVRIERSAFPFEVSQIRAVVYHNRLEVGIAEDLTTYRAGHMNGALTLRLPSATVHRIESARVGGPATFDLRVICEVRRLISHHVQADPKANARQNPDADKGCLGFVVLTADARPETTAVTLTYPRDAWVTMLNETGVGENVVVEIPLPPSPAAPWDAVWTPLRQAKNALQSGGETSTTTAITLCRQALEAWRKVDGEGEDRGPGWPTPSEADRKARTRKQRLDVLRWDIHQIAHDVVHNASGNPTRAEAVLVLSTLTSLLAARNP